MIRQLKDAPDTVRIEAFVMHARGGGATDLLRQVRYRANDADHDLYPASLRAFRVAQSTTAELKRGSGRGAFIDSVLQAIDDFYEQIIQNLKPWMPAPPRLRTPDKNVAPVQPVAASLGSTAISSQDSPEFDTPAARDSSSAVGSHSEQ